MEKLIILCIPTLNRYDLLVKTLESAERGEIKPDFYYIIDNGGKLDLSNLPEIFNKRTYVMHPNYNLGVAASWNKFLNLDGIKIICNDDVEFFHDTIKLLVEYLDENFITYPAGIPSANSFSCFLIPDKIIKEVGEFDEEFWPAYYEDNSYHRKMKMRGYDLKGIENCSLGHFGSATLKSFTQDELNAHHHRFRRNTELYKRMWGGLVSKETYTEKFNGDEDLKMESMQYLEKHYGY